MKKAIGFAFIFWVLLLPSVMAQGRWTEFRLETEEFTVETPVALRGFGGSEPSRPRRYSASAGEVYYFIFSDPIRDQFYARAIKRYVGESGEIFPETAAGSMSNLKFTDQYGYANEIVVASTATRIYVAQVVSRPGVDEADVRRFVSSFSVEGGLLPPSYAAEPPAKATDSEVHPLATDIERGGQGGGIGRNVQMPPPLPARPPAAAPKGVSTPLRILKKGLPTYTEWARFYGLSGKVLTRVSFLGSGEIGAVSVISGLPFGLSQQAIIAARQITFEPAYRDGKAMETVKAVEFNFSIY